LVLVVLVVRENLMVLGIMVELVETLLSSVRPHMVAVVVANITQLVIMVDLAVAAVVVVLEQLLLEDQRPLDLEVMLEDMRILHQVLPLIVISTALAAAVVPEQ
tara:strand:- start:960 stop:1271 length:312 start_codon:yes stop_codon:yes gene_type:complete